MPTAQPLDFLHRHPFTKTPMGFADALDHALTEGDDDLAPSQRLWTMIEQIEVLRHLDRQWLTIAAASGSKPSQPRDGLVLPSPFDAFAPAPKDYASEADRLEARIEACDNALEVAGAAYRALASVAQTGNYAILLRDVENRVLVLPASIKPGRQLQQLLEQAVARSQALDDALSPLAILASHGIGVCPHVPAYALP